MRKLLRAAPPGHNQWMLALTALAWTAVLGVEPPAWPPWASLAAALPWLLYTLPGAAVVRLVLFPLAMALFMASSSPLEFEDLAGVLFLFIAYVGFTLARPAAPAVDYSPVEPRGELRGRVPAAFLVWSAGLVLLAGWSGARPAWILVSAIFCASHFGVWRRLARAGRQVRAPLTVLVLATLLAILGAVAWHQAGAALKAASGFALVVWVLGVGRLRTGPASSAGVPAGAGPASSAGRHR